MRCRPLLGLALASSFILCVNREARSDATGQSFSAVVEANFSKWDKNHDGKLEAKEVADLLTEHSIAGDAAAALAAIHVYQRGQKNGGIALTKEILIHTKDGAAGRRDR